MEKCNDIIEKFYFEYTGKKVKILPKMENIFCNKIMSEELEIVQEEYGSPLLDIIGGILISAGGIEEAEAFFEKNGWPKDNYLQQKAEFSLKLAIKEEAMLCFKLTNPLVAACNYNSFESIALAEKIIKHRSGFHYKVSIDYDVAYSIAKRLGQLSIKNLIKKEFPNDEHFN